VELVECVPNFSEGRRLDVIEAIVAAAGEVPGVRVLGTHSDPDHNRSVLTYVAPPEAALQAGFAVVHAAVEQIDLRQHSGAHPRMGALDVFPFVPLGETPMARCVELAHTLGERVAAELDVPVYFYEEAALSDERRALERIRRKGFEDLRETIAHDPERQPDRGPQRVHPSAGAIAIGARQFLIAFNVYLSTLDPALAKSIARRIRASSGGLRYVKALGLKMAGTGETQVSMNLTNFRASSIVTVMDLIRAEAARHGVAVTHSEVVGLIPLDALLDAAVAFLQLEDFAPEQVLERRLWE
jgi:glutamate formiminotransferase